MTENAASAGKTETTFLEVSVPVIGRTRLESSVESRAGGVRVRLEHDQHRVLSRASACSPIADVDVPSLTPGGGPADYSLRVPDSPAGLALEARLRSLEGALSLFGVERFDFTRLSRKWFTARVLGEEENVIFAMNVDHHAPPLSDEIIPAGLVQHVAGVALDPSNDPTTLSLLLFNRGWDQYCNFHNIEAIWYFSLFVEHSFARGKFDKKGQTAAYRSTPEMRAAFLKAKQDIDEAVKRGDISRHDAEKFLVSVAFEDFVEWLFHLRGRMFHQSSKRSKNWHPSNAVESKKDAVVLATFCSAAALQMPQAWFEQDH